MSYRGCTGRFRLWVTLCAYFNATAAFVTFCVVLPAFVLLMWCLFPEPMYYVWSVFLSIHSFQNPIMNQILDPEVGRASDHPFNSIFPAVRSWFIFFPYGLFILSFLYWFWNPVCTWFSKRRPIFFDKFCVHQSHNGIQAAGLYRMPLYLKNSKTLLAVFDAQLKKNLASKIFGYLARCVF